MTDLVVSFLGGFTVTHHETALTQFYSDKVRALLAYLVVESEQTHSRSKLAGLLWPDVDESTARQSLRQALTQLRRMLNEKENEPPFLLVETQTIGWNSEAPLTLDVQLFEEALNIPNGASNAVALYQGDFLDGFYLNDSDLFEEWLLLKRETLRQDALAAIEMVTLTAENRGETTEAQKFALHWRTLDPLQEEAHRSLIRSAAAQGNLHQAQEYYDQCVETLATEMGMVPSRETTALLEQIQASSNAEQDGFGLNQLPLPPTPFIGRSLDIERVEQLLAQPHARLVTILGTGGTGKTRLALEILQRLAAEERAVGFVSLVGLEASDHDLAAALASAIGDALGMGSTGELSPQDALLNFLRSKTLLLALDNFEQLLIDPTLAAPRYVARLLEELPNLQLLVTSRQRLKFQAEQVYRLEGLLLPPESQNGADGQNGLGEKSNAGEERDAAQESDAVQLFISQAERTLGGFEMNAQDWPHVFALCQMVEGMPLAIELLCAWLPTMTLTEIREEATHGIDLLKGEQLLDVPERHRSVYAVCDYSIQQLPKAIRKTFYRLSVFRGGFDRVAAKQIADASPLALSHLVEASLLRRDRAGRYTIHTLLRQVGASHLRAEEEALQLRHAAYYAGWLQNFAGELISGSMHSLSLIAGERDNIDLMWHYALRTQNIMLIDQSVDARVIFCEAFGRNVTTVTIVEAALDVVGAAEETIGLRCRLHIYLSRAYGSLLSMATALEMSRECYRLALQQDNQMLIGLAVTTLAIALNYAGLYDAVDELLPNAEKIIAENPTPWSVGYFQLNLGLHNDALGDIAASRRAFERADSSFAESGPYLLSNKMFRVLMEIWVAYLIRVDSSYSHLMPAPDLTVDEYHGWLWDELNTYDEQIKALGNIPYYDAMNSCFKALMYVWGEGNLQVGLPALEQSVEKYQQVNSPQLASLMQASLVECHSLLGNPGQAAIYLKEAAVWMPQVSGKNALNTILSFSHYYRKIHDWESAARCLLTVSQSPITPWLPRQIANIFLKDVRPNLDEHRWQQIQLAAQENDPQTLIADLVAQLETCYSSFP